MIRVKLLEEIARVDGLLAENALAMRAEKLMAKEKKRLTEERKKLEKYKKELQREWQHLSH